MGRRDVTALVTVALVETARRARRRHVSGAEEHLFRVVNNTTDRVRVPVWAIMQSGSLAAVFVAAAAQHARGRRATAVASLIAGVSVWAAVKAIKPRIGRGRPDRHLRDVTVRGKPQTGLGYPSGHAAVATTLALIATRHSGRTAKAVALALAGSTGAARMYAGAHLPLDVAGGTAIGILAGRATNALLQARAPR